MYVYKNSTRQRETLLCSLRNSSTFFYLMFWHKKIFFRFFYMYVILSSSATAASCMCTASGVKFIMYKKCVYSFTLWKKSAVLDVCSGNQVKSWWRIKNETKYIHETWIKQRTILAWTIKLTLQSLIFVISFQLSIYIFSTLEYRFLY